MKPELRKYADKQYLQFRPMIEKTVWHYSKKYYDLEYDDIRSEAYEIFCKVIERYNYSKASFSTYLFNNLKKLLGYYCIKQIKLRNQLPIDYDKSEFIDFDIYDEENNIPKELYSYDMFIKTLERIDTKLQLSNDAQDVIDFITSFSWYIPGLEGRIKPSYHALFRIYKYEKNWMPKRFENTWIEIKKWWQESNKDQFCMEG